MDPVDQAYRENAALLRGLGYRLLGDAMAAEDLVQETFVRALEKPPADLSRGLLPWLKRVATNIGIDQLRRRQHKAYTGPWLPMPLETGAGGVEIAAPHEVQPEARYDRIESLSFGFLVALEVLTPKQRAVLVLRDVLDDSVADVAESLEISEADVKTTLHRARAGMAGYDTARAVPDDARRERVRLALETLLEAVAKGERSAADALLAGGIEAFTDAGGEFFASRKILQGRERVGTFLWNLATKGAPDVRMDIREINFLPALVVELVEPKQGQAPRLVQRIDLDAEGRIATWHAILASGKLAGVSFDGIRPGLGAFA